MFKQTIKPVGPGKPTSVPNPGAVSAVGPTGAAPKPRRKNTRDYGKITPVAPGSSPSPFGPTEGGSRIGGI